jgi:transposase
MKCKIIYTLYILHREEYIVMEKIKLRITQKEIQKLDEIRLHSEVTKERQKAGAIYWRAIGKTEEQIREITGLSVTTIVRHIKKYNELGFAYLKENNYKGNTSDLEEFSGLIIADFNEKRPKTIDEAIERIEKLTGVKRSATRVTVFLKKNCLRTKKQEVYRQKQTKRIRKSS